MLGRLVLLLLQIVIGWFGTNALMGFMSGVPGTFTLYVFAIIAAIVIFLIGLIGSQVLKEVGQPSSSTLSWSLALALIAALLWSFGPTYLPAVQWSVIQAKYAVFAAAIIGYLIKR